MNTPGSQGCRLILVISHLSGVLAGAVAAMLGPLLPWLAGTWALTDSESGRLLAWEFFGGFCGAMASGALGARYSMTSLLKAGLLSLALSLTGASLLLRDWFPACLFGCGFAMGFVNPMANILVARIGYPSPAAALNLFGFFWAAGAVGAPSAIALLLAHETPSAVFLEAAILTSIVAALALTARIPASLRASPAAIPGSATTASGAAWFVPITAAILFLYVGVETSVSVWLPAGAARWTAMTVSGAASIQSIFWAALLVGRLFAPAILRRVTPRLLILAGLLLSATGIAIAGASSRPVYLATGAALAGLGLAPVNPTVIAMFTTRMGSAASQWAGPVFAAAGLGGAAIPWMVGAISSHSANLRTGFAALLVCLAVMLGLASLRYDKSIY